MLKDIRLSDPALPVLVLSMHDESLYAERALRAGANGYIMKQEATERVLQAIRRIRGGEVYVSDRIAKTAAAADCQQPGVRQIADGSADAIANWPCSVLSARGAARARSPTTCTSASRPWNRTRRISKKSCRLKNARELVQHAFQWVTSEDGP